MKVINEINHSTIGRIFCIADENGNPFMWVKVLKIKIFSNIEENIDIGLSFYCFNKDFKYDSFWNNDAENIESAVCLTYQKFLSEISKVELEFYNYFNNYYFDEFEPNITKQDVDIQSEKDLYHYITVDEVRILASSYSIIVETPWEEERMGMVIYNDEDGITVNYESEVEPVEMDYE